MTLPTVSVLRLDPAAASIIARAAEESYPNEACGVLIGHPEEGGWRVTAAVPGTNVHPEPRRHFEVDPRLVFDLMRKLRGGPNSLIGHFHSHPDGAAEPSPTDRDSAYDRNAIWLIAGVSAGRIGAVRAFRLDKGEEPAFIEIPVTLPSR